jgi:hypothetical protein
METICSICHTDFDEEEDLNFKLRCGHKFHLECIFIIYSNNLDSKKIIRQCPYCRKDGGYIRLDKNIIPIKHIHEEYNVFQEYINNKDTEQFMKFLNDKKCIAILKSGKNKGQQCNNNPLHDKYCKKHYNFNNKNNIVIE